jgi:hypothetical protein
MVGVKYGAAPNKLIEICGRYGACTFKAIGPADSSAPINPNKHAAENVDKKT